MAYARFSLARGEGLRPALEGVEVGLGGEQFGVVRLVDVLGGAAVGLGGEQFGGGRLVVLLGDAAFGVGAFDGVVRGGEGCLLGGDA